MQIVAEYIDYLETEKSLSFNSLRLYKRDLLDFDAFMRDRYPSVDIKSLDGEHLDKFRIWILNQGKSTATVNRKLTAVHGMWTWLRESNQVERDPFTQIVRESQHRNKELSHLSIEEINQLLDCKELDLRSRMVLELMYATGIRIGELAKLRIEDINLERQILAITSRGKERTVPFNKLSKELLEEYIQENALSESNRLLSSKRGETLSEREIFRIVTEASEKAGLDEVSPSIIRNSFIKHMKDNGAHEVFLRDVSGQKNFLV